MTDTTEETEEITSFYQLLYENRLNWVKKKIPVRFKDKVGHYMAGYLSTPGKRKDDGFVTVQPAYIPQYEEPKTVVGYDDIYPTDRAMTILREDGTLERTDPIPMTEDQKLLFDVPHRDISESDLYKFFGFYKSTAWTLQEVASAVAVKPSSLKVIKDFRDDCLIDAYERTCLITGNRAMTYTMKPSTPKATDGETLVQVEADYTDCQLCELGRMRGERGASLVFGKGSATAKGLILGEAPGVIEEAKREPFSNLAPAGNILHRVMAKVGLDPNDWYLTNSVCCRPPPEDGSRSQNGKPEPDHISACLPRLKRTLRAVSPKLVVLLGKYAYETFFARPLPGGKMKHNIGWVPCEYYDVYLAYHPSYIKRQESFPDAYAREATAYLEDWEQIAERYQQL